MSTKDILLAGINEAVAKRNNMKFEDYQKAANESFATDRDAEKGVINSAHDASKANVQTQYDNAVTDTKVGYESEYQKNAVQKLINEKKVAETNANLGLTDSGLNRTQQTAVQLSYANQKGKIDLARQGVLDDLALNLTSALTEIETNRSVDLLAADQKYNDKAYLAAQTNYNNDLTALNNQIASGYEQYSAIAQAEIDAAAEVQKAQISASAKTPTVSYGAGGTSNGNYILKISGGLLSRDFIGSLADNNINVIYNKDGTTTYVDNNSGKKTTLDSDINPYTGTRNNDADYGVFANGYQPDNVKGEKLKKVKDVIVSVKGNNQSVWYANGVYYVWDGDNNEYHQLTRIEEYRLGL